MRIAVAVIGALLGLGVGVQSCVVGVGGAAFEQQSSADAGTAGVFVAFLMLVAAGLVYGLPRIAAGILAFGGLIGLIAGIGSDFTDLGIWGGVSLVLAAGAVAGHFEKRRKAANAPPVALPSARWYPDPRGRARLRYWDGAQWTDTTSD